MMQLLRTVSILVCAYRLLATGFLPPTLEFRQ